jgi:hypothetical protein
MNPDEVFDAHCRWQYVDNWHVCPDCGCLRPDRELRTWDRKGETLRVCKDQKTCRALKRHRERSK